MTKQEFMAMSLPYGLKARIKTENEYIHNVDHYMYQYICDSEKDEDLYKYDLILRPLSDLTKEIEHNGKKFVPHKKLDNMPNLVDYTIHDVNQNINKFSFELFQKLIEWHFDLANLIESGEAIDVNTLEINPYKT